MESIKETKEALHGSFVLAEIIGAELKDGVQAADLVAIVQKILADEAKKAALDAAIKDIQKVPAEVKDLSLAEGVELAQVVIHKLPDLLKALSK